MDAIRLGTATVVEHVGRITGYATTIGFLGHAVAESNEDLKALDRRGPELPRSGIPATNAQQ